MRWLLQRAAQGGFEVFLLGDIVELWIGDDDDAPLARELRALLSATANHTPVHLMHGNRDFLYGDAFEADTGVRLIEDPHPLEDGVLLAHGDAYCTDDTEYQAFRQLVRSPDWQADILGRSVDERRAFGEGLRAQSRATNANKAANIMDTNPDAVLAAMDAHASQVLVHGHTHRPGHHSGPERYVLGAWERCGWYVEQIDSAFSLKCFSLAARYESGTEGPAAQ